MPCVRIKKDRHQQAIFSDIKFDLTLKGLFQKTGNMLWLFLIAIWKLLNNTNQTLILLNTLKKNLQGYMYNVRFLNHDIQFMRESFLRANFCVVECI